MYSVECGHTASLYCAMSLTQLDAVLPLYRSPSVIRDFDLEVSKKSNGPKEISFINV